MEYIYLLFAIMLYFPLTLSDKLGSEGTEEKLMLFKYSFYRSLIGIITGGVILMCTGSKIHLDLYTVLTALLFGLMLGLCMLVTLYSMQVTTVAVASVFKAGSVIIPCVFGAAFFDETISVVNIIGFATFLISIYLIVSKTQERKMQFGLKALLACLGVLLTNGVGSVAMQLFGKCVHNGDEALFMFLSYCVQSLILLMIYLRYRTTNKSQNSQKISKKLWLCGITGTVSAFLIQQIMASLTSDISALVIFPATMGSSVIVGVLVGWICFKEKTTFKSALGTIIGIVSLIMINMF